MTTAAPGICGCSAVLAPGQRYCIACGERRGELPFRVPERSEPPPGPPLAGRKSFGAVTAIVLASGVLIGATVGPAITPASLASTAGDLILVARGGGIEAASPATPITAAPSLTALSAPTGDVGKPPPLVVDRGGAAAQQPAPAASAPPVSPPAAKPATPPPTSLPPAVPEPDPSVTGVVVHLPPDGHSYAIATKEGQLLVVHTKKPPTVLGDNLKVTVHALDDGTFDERATKALDHADTATITGTVTFADAVTGTYAMSARGVSMLVHLPPPQQVPAVGIQTTVDVALGPQLLETRRVDGEPVLGELDLEAIVRDPGPNPDPTKLIVSADDAGESPATLTLSVPPKVDVSKLTKPGTVISAVVKREADGSLTLVSASAA